MNTLSVCFTKGSTTAEHPLSSVVFSSQPQPWFSDTAVLSCQPRKVPNMLWLGVVFEKKRRT
jgi:hypothetical protein